MLSNWIVTGCEITWQLQPSKCAGEVSIFPPFLKAANITSNPFLHQSFSRVHQIRLQVQCWIKYPKHSGEQAQTERLESDELKGHAHSTWMFQRCQKKQHTQKSACGFLRCIPSSQAKGNSSFNCRMYCHSSLGRAGSIRGGRAELNTPCSRTN